MCDPTMISMAVLMAGSFAASTAIADQQREQSNRMMEEQIKMAETQAKRAEELRNQDVMKPKKAKPEEALYGTRDTGIASTTLTGPQGSEVSQGLLGKSTLLGG